MSSIVCGRSGKPWAVGTLVAFSAVATAVHAQPLRWTAAFPQGHQDAVYDSSRGVIVTYGLASDSANPLEMWERAGQSDTWRQLTLGATRPPAPYTPLSAYDAGRDVITLYVNSQTWEYEDSAWIRRTPSAPLPPADGVMVHDSHRGVSVLFARSQTWEWDGVAWNQRIVASPSERFGHAMTYDSDRHVTVLFGGGLGVAAAETWEWDGAAWTQRPHFAPAARGYAAMAYDPERRVTVMHGGQSGTVFDDTWEWNGSLWTQRASSGPGARANHRMVYDATRRRCVIIDTSARDRAWEWDGTAATWTPGSQNPLERDLASSAYDSTRGVGVLFGGVDRQPTSTVLGDTWEWSGATWVRKHAGGSDAPSPRVGAAMAYDAHRGVTVLFGGASLPSAGLPNPFGLSDTWEWDGATWTRRLVAGPPARSGAAMGYDPVRRVCVLFGGWTTPETWEWNGELWTLRATSGPQALMGSRMVYDESNGEMVLFGGVFDCCVRSNQTWVWNGSAWSQRMVPGPEGRGFHGMVYDARRGVVLLHAGLYTNPFTYLSDLWAWDGKLWTQLAPQGSLPTGRGSHVMFYDSLREATVVFGGLHSPNADFRNLGDSWVLSEPCAAPGFSEQPAPIDAKPGAAATFSVTPSGGGPYVFAWRRNGVPLADVPGRVSGSRNPTLLLTDLSLAAAGSYDCVLTNQCGVVTSSAATLTICAADFNADGVANSADFFDFLVAFFNNAPEADFNRDTAINSQDFFDFLNQFFLGCP